MAKGKSARSRKDVEGNKEDDAYSTGVGYMSDLSEVGTGDDQLNKEAGAKVIQEEGSE